jgi:alanine dehydrogenase
VAIPARDRVPIAGTAAFRARDRVTIREGLVVAVIVAGDRAPNLTLDEMCWIAGAADVDTEIERGNKQATRKRNSPTTDPVFLTDEGYSDVPNGFFNLPRFCNHHDLKPYY